MDTFIPTLPITQLIEKRRAKLASQFFFQSKILNQFVFIPSGFIFDWESIPIIRGTNPVCGLIHDYLCRIDSIPVVTKKVAADVYMEAMKYRGAGFFKRWVKYCAVMVTPKYFHKFKVLETFGCTEK